MNRFKLKLLRWLFKYSSPFTKILEKRAIKKYAKKGSNYSPVFIIGAPRSGSTILYQLITSYFDFLYINNFINLAREITFIGFLLNHKFLKKKAHNSFESKFGDTSNDGLLAPNEGLFWYKWLPKNKHYVHPDELSIKQKQAMKDYFHAIMNKTQKSLVIKNLSFSMRLELIKDLFPDAKIIFIRRNPVNIVQSIYKVKRKLNIKDNQLWSIKPPNYKELEKLPIIEQVVKQVFYIEKNIFDSLSKYNQEQYIELKYEELKDCREKINVLSSFLGLKPSSEIFLKNKIDINSKQSLPNHIYQRIIDEVKKLDWVTFKDE